MIALFLVSHYLVGVLTTICYDLLGLLVFHAVFICVFGFTNLNTQNLIYMTMVMATSGVITATVD